MKFLISSISFLLILTIVIVASSFRKAADPIVCYVRMEHADLPVKHAEIVYLQSVVLNEGDMSMQIRYKEVGRTKVQEDGSFIFDPAIPADVIKAIGTGDFFPAESIHYSTSEVKSCAKPFKLLLAAPVYVNLALLDNPPLDYKVLMAECWLGDKNNITPRYVMRHEKNIAYTPSLSRDLKLYYRFIKMDQSKTEITEVNLGRILPLDTLSYSITF